MDDLEDRIARLKTLTPQQAKILTLVCAGNADAEITRTLFIAASTLYFHKANIYDKLGLSELNKGARQRELGKYCIAGEHLDADELAPSPEAETDPPVPSERALVAVREDDRDLVVRPRPEIQVRIPPGTLIGHHTETGRRINPFLLLFLTALGASLVSAALVAVVFSRVQAPGPVIVERPMPVPVTVVPATAEQTRPTVVPSSASRPGTPTRAPTAVPPPPPEPGTILYEADWSGGTRGWGGPPDWKVGSAMLLNDGSGSGSKFMPILSPQRSPDIADYAVEADIRVLPGGSRASFGVVVRADGKSGGYAVGVGSGWGRTAKVVRLEGLWGTNIIDARVAEGQVFDPGTGWHTYRAESKGNAITLLIDGAVMVTGNDNRYLSGGQQGLWSNQYQLEVRSFRVIAL